MLDEKDEKYEGGKAEMKMYEYQNEKGSEFDLDAKGLDGGYLSD